ncbi:MAG: class I SAM-dependent methyltransferase [Candidatus Methanofastidiosia archaeon]
MSEKEKAQIPQANCCGPTEVEEEASSCCNPLDTGEQTVLEQQGKRKARPVYSGWVTAETKYGMYSPAIESGTLRDSSGTLKYPLPGPIGITEVVREASIEEGNKVLEVAASMGHIAMLAAKIVRLKGESVLAQLDVTLVESAEAYIAKYGLQDSVRVVEASAEEIPYPEDYFDAVISDRAVCCLYSKIENQQRLMNEIARVTKPGGRVVFIEAVPKGTPPPKGKRIPGCITSITFTKEPEKVVEMLRKAGLESISIKRIPNSKMATKEMAEAANVPIGDEYMEFAILSGTKKRVY